MQKVDNTYELREGDGEDIEYIQKEINEKT